MDVQQQLIQIHERHLSDEKHWIDYSPTLVHKDRAYLLDLVKEQETEIQRLTQALETMKDERDEARLIVALVNNEVLGSAGYFTSPSCVEAVQKLKEYANAQQAEGTALRAQLVEVEQSRYETAEVIEKEVRLLRAERNQERARLVGLVETLRTLRLNLDLGNLSLNQFWQRFREALAVGPQSNTK